MVKKELTFEEYLAEKEAMRQAELKAEKWYPPVLFIACFVIIFLMALFFGMNEPSDTKHHPQAMNQIQAAEYQAQKRG